MKIQGSCTGADLTNQHRLPTEAYAHALVQNLRTVAAVRHFIFGRANIKPGDLAAENKALDDQLEKNRKTHFAYGNFQIETYRKFSGNVPQIEQQAAELWEQVFAANQPRSHGYEIRRQ